VIKTPLANVERFQTIVAITYYPLLLLSFAGAIYFAATRSGRGEIVLLSMYLMAAAVHALFVQRLRYRAEVDFLIIIVAANFVAAIISRILDSDRSGKWTIHEPIVVPIGTGR
jgi:hypothetical protein